MAKKKPIKTEAEAIARFRNKKYAKPGVTVDIVILTILDADLKVLLIQRDEHPFKDEWAIPGGFVRVGDGVKDQGEDLDEAAERRLAEETSLPVGSVFLEQLYTFGQAHRDPRMRVITVAYFALVRPDLAPLVKAGGRTADTRWVSVAEELPSMNLAFDHADILNVAMDRIRGKLAYSAISFELVPDTFSIAELRSVHDVISGESLDRGNFRRRFHRLIEDGFIEKAPGKRITGKRHATVYRFTRPSNSK